MFANNALPLHCIRNFHNPPPPHYQVANLGKPVVLDTTRSHLSRIARISDLRMVALNPFLLGLLTCLPYTGPGTASALPFLQISGPPGPLPECAPADELKWQPVLDYDQDSCYNVAAIGMDGRVSEGLPLTHHLYSGDCRDERDSKYPRLKPCYAAMLLWYGILIQCD